MWWWRQEQVGKPAKVKKPVPIPTKTMHYQAPFPVNPSWEAQPVKQSNSGKVIISSKSVLDYYNKLLGEIGAQPLQASEVEMLAPSAPSAPSKDSLDIPF